MSEGKKKRKTHGAEFKAKAGLEAVRGVKTINEIAQVMCLSQKTIANYQSSIRQKLELTNAAQVVRLAMSYGLLDQGTASSDGRS